MKLDPIIEKFELEVIQKFSKNPIFAQRDEATSKVLMYFITRKELTQKQLQKLTGLSAGKISQEVNDMLDKNLIKIASKSSTGQITYSMESVKSELFTRFINYLKAMVLWEDKLQNIHDDLEKNKDKLENLNGFFKIKEIVDYFLSLMPKYREQIKIYEKRKKIIST